MKYINFKKICLPLLIILTVSVAGCGKKESNDVTENKMKTESSGETNEMKKTDNMSGKNTSDHIMVSLPTMQCSTCKKNIETAVKKLDGIESINVVVKEKTAHINYDKSKTDLTKIESVITAAGYDANDKKADPEAYKELDDCCKLPKDQKGK
ncbi:MAG: heavy-metal-associated domain-containing protein [Bacteroidetes bacterium]|nr:heavy-metal-associated domain-containing protein [Bacteroidota bacterium]